MYTIEEFDEQKTRIMKYIIFKKRTEKEVRDKFKGNIDENLLNDIIDYLKEAKYLDDNEYLEKAIQNIMILKSQSIKEIQYKLLTKGIDKNQLEKYISENEDELNEYELNSAQKIVSKKMSKEPEQIKAYLLRKGYKMDNVRKAFEEFNID